MAQIIYHQRTLPTGDKIITYEWDGDIRDAVRLPYDVDITKLPFNLVKIEGEADPYLITYIRKDAPLFSLYFLASKVKPLWLNFFYRFMRTLNIWGLAHTPQGCAPSIRDILK